MKKRRLKLLLIILAITVIAAVIIYNNHQNNIEETSADVQKNIDEIPIQWHANYIWDDSTEDNTWMCFRKKVNIDEENLKNIVAQIAVDSKYWLYINDEMVVREGALKRGETPNSIYYDEIDLTKYLHKGENTIAVLVWYWGGESYSHNSSGQGAMLFQAKIGDNYLITDETWKVSKHKAYLQDSLRPNNRLIEYNVYFDASLDDENWYKSEYDDVNWKNSKIIGLAGSAPWGDMIKREIPQFKNYDLKEYENIENYANYTTTKTETLEMIIPYNAQFTPYLKIEAPKNKKITIKTDQYSDISGDSVMCTYLTKEGSQEFESLAWMNGEKVYYEIPKGVKIISLGYRESGYNSEMTGKFESDDEFFNKLWKMASRTLYVNMRDSYMDCPNRERAQWWGDMSVEMLQAMYALDTNAYNLYEKGVKTTIGWRDENTLLTVAPITADYLHLPTQMLAGINSMYEYYEYTGKQEFLEYVYPYVKDYLNCWQQNESGLMDCTITYPIWEWGDSVAECDYKAIENAWYYLALSKTKQMAEVLGYNEDVKIYTKTLKNLKESYNNLWTENGYKTENSKIIDERANALAVISGLSDESKYEIITEILQNSYESTVYMEKYALEALCKMGKIEQAQERIKKRYAKMVNGENSCSTLWENWNFEIGTKNHAWAGGPLVIMSKYFAGIEPLEKGYDVISIKPQFGNLTSISSSVTTAKGDVKLDAEKSNENITLNLEVPAKTRIAVPKMGENTQIIVNEKVVYKDNKFKKNKIAEYNSEDSEYIYFYVQNGKYEIEVKG